jgi:hypothetical protein
MNGGRLVLSIIVGFVFIFATDFLIHAVWLAGDYKASAALWRPEDEMHRRFIILLFAQFVAAVAFLYIWARTGWRRRTLLDGCWFGFWMGLFQQVTTLVIYVVEPFPLKLAIKWFFAGLLQAILLGALASVVYKPRAILGDRQP